jgi:hypothetical protein
MPYRRRYTGPVPTLVQLRHSTCWTWICCEGPGCRHSAPWAITPLIVRWGEQASSDVLRQRARCTRCGFKGASLRHPSWLGNIAMGECGFPVERIVAW